MMMKIIATTSLIILGFWGSVWGQSEKDSLAGFNEDSLRSVLMEQGTDLDEIPGIIRYEKLKFVGLKRGTWNTVYQQNRNVRIDQSCTNADFEDDTFNGWNGFTGCNPEYSGCGGGCCSTPGFVTDRHTIHGPGSGNDLYGGFPKVYPEGSYSVQLGNNFAGAKAESISQTFVVDPSNTVFTYYYAVVLEVPQNEHEDYELPYFDVEMVDASGSAVSCSQYSVTAVLGIPGFQNSDFDGNGDGESDNVIYKPWTANAIDLSAYVGQTVTITFSTYDCSKGGHFGYAYIDGSCFADDIVITGTPCKGEALSFYNASVGSYTGETYVWDFGDGTAPSTLASPTHVYANPGSYTVTLTISHPDQPGCDRIFTETFIIEHYIDCDEVHPQISTQGECAGASVVFGTTGYPEEVSPMDVTWDFGDGHTGAGLTPDHIYAEPGTYHVNATITVDSCCSVEASFQITIKNCINCDECIGSFAPIPGEKYVLSAWVKEANGTGKITYDGPAIELSFDPVSPSEFLFKASGLIIDGWQRIEKEFTVPVNAEKIHIKLRNTGNEEVFFDDIRVHPFRADMKSFVYDPVSLRLMAELDERNYATFYEYDEEGALIRIKKETERGIKTIQESGNHTQIKIHP